jgi:hypothetical protein
MFRNFASEIVTDHLRKKVCALGWVSAFDANGAQFESVTRVAATGSASSCEQMKY